MAFKLKREGVSIKGISGDRCQMQLTRMDVSFETTHQHPEEQMGFIISGKIEITIGSETRLCEAGDGYYIPAYMKHSFKVVSEGYAEVVDIFSPPKEENK